MESDLQSVLDRWQKGALTTGAIALALAAGGLFLNPTQFFRSYLFAYLFWIGVALGSLVISLIHHLSGGRWGAVVRRLLESATRTIPLLAILFLPILIGLHSLYEWTDTTRMAASEALKHKSIYLNVPFFLIRAALYFAIWAFLSHLLNRWSKQEDETPDPILQARFQWLGGSGLLLYGLTMTFASVDWMMSLEPHWFSTIYGLLVITGQVLSAFAFVIAVAALLANYKPLSDVIGKGQFHDLGNLMLAFVMIWAYLSVSQFLIIWSGNLPEEIPWYIHRLHGGWQWMGAALILFHFALPFLLLLSRRTKQNPSVLAFVAIAVILMRFVDLFWLVAPDFHGQGLSVHYLDLLLPAGVGGIWLAFFFRQLKLLPLVPVNDPNLKGLMEHGRA